MTKLTQDQRIDRLAEWAKLDQHGWRRSDQGFWHPSGGGPCLAFNPFVDRNDAFLLLEECEGRRLSDTLAMELMCRAVIEDESGVSLVKGIVMLSAAQQTEAVWVAARLGEE